jgi:parallel beta-helix repeat protein
MGIPYFIVGDAGGQCADLVSNNTPPVWYQLGETRVLGYLKVAVDPANNTATAQEIIIASVQEDDDNETPYVYPQPDVIDTFTFPLKTNPSPPDPLGIPITAPAVISTPGHYRLMNNLSNSTAETAILITASDVLLDGNGHILEGDQSENSKGLLISGGPAGTGNVTVRGLTVSDWEMGISANNLAGGEISGCNATRSVFGVYINSSEGVLLKGVNASGNIPKNGGGGTGITLYYSPSCIVTCSTASRNGWGAPLEVGGYGVLLDQSPGTEISGCTINGNLNTAIEDNSAPAAMLLTRNEISENGGNGGIFLGTLHSSRTQNCTISENQLSKNAAGITIDQADHCLMDRNEVTGGGVGISIVSSRNATLTGNVMAGNEFNLQVYSSEEQYYQHVIGTSNTVNGKPVYYFYQKPGAVVDATSRAGTVYGIGSPGIIIQDVTLTNSSTGVFLFDSDSAQVRNVTTGGNQVGISITGCNDLSVNNSTASGNSVTGFDIQNSGNVTLRGVIANENRNPHPDTGSGISIDTGSNIYIINATTDRNKFAGIEISGSDKTLLSQVAASGNGVAGLVISGDGTQVTGCRIWDNGEAGIGLIRAYDSMIVNNWLSNTVNVQIGDDVTGTIWNTPKTAGNNIVNGPFLGGNYWANPAGTGWSQVTPDRGDGFCTAPFVIDANNTDFLPLHSYTPKPTLLADFEVSPVTGNAPLTVKCTDKSIGNPSMRVYNFGDGVNVTGPNPVHTYRFPGVYTITLTITKYNPATDSVMSSVATKTNVITVTKVPFVIPVAKFTASPVNGTAPLTVTFTDQSAGNPTFYNYDFGDGVNMTGSNPVHTYRLPGIYNVTLTVLKNDGLNGSVVSNASVQNGLIRVNGK